MMRFLLIIFVWSGHFAQAQFADTFAVGPGVRLESNNREANTLDGYDEDSITRFWPVGYLIYGPFMVNDKGLQFSVVQSLPLAVYAVTNLHGEKYASTGMSEVSQSLFAGAGIRIYPLSIYTMFDMENQSQGRLSRAQLQAPLKLGDWLLLPTLGTTYYNANYNDHYYGVTGAQATAERPQYSGGSGTDVFLNLKVFWNFMGPWELYLMAEGRQFSAEITDSPTVKDEVLTTTVLGIDYKFF